MDDAFSRIREEAVRGGIEGMQAALNTFARIMEERRNIRTDMNKWVSQVMDPGNPVGWDAYFSQAKARNEAFPQFIQDITDEFRAQALKGEFKPSDAVWDAIERQARMNDEEIDSSLSKVRLSEGSR